MLLEELSQTNQILLNDFFSLNVADYVVKSNMRRNNTWGGDVEEMFTAALLMRTDI